MVGDGERLICTVRPRELHLGRDGRRVGGDTLEFDNGVSATRGYVEGNPFALVIHSSPRISKPDAGGIRKDIVIGILNKVNHS